MKIFIGILAGIINGMFSTGGGMILVPALIYILNMEDIKARATSIFCIIPIVIINIIFYNAKKIDIGNKVILLCAIGGIIGGYIGSKLLVRLPQKMIKIIFTIFIIYAGFKFIIA